MLDLLSKVDFKVNNIMVADLLILSTFNQKSCNVYPTTYQSQLYMIIT